MNQISLESISAIRCDLMNRIQEPMIKPFQKVCRECIINESDNIVKYDTRIKMDRLMLRESKIRSKNYDSHQLCFIINMLCRMGYSINIQKLYKRGEKTDQILRVKSVKKGDTVKYTEDTICEENDDKDLKRKRRNIDSRTNNSLLMILEGEGCDFATKKCKEFKLISFNQTEGKKRLNWFFDGEYKYSKDEINRIGEETYNFIISRLNKHDYTVTKQDIDVISI